MATQAPMFVHESDSVRGSVESLCEQAVELIEEKGDGLRAMEVIQLATQKAEMTHGPSHPLTAHCHMVAAEIYIQCEQPQLAEQASNKALVTWLNLTGPFSEKTIGSRVLLGRSLLAQDRIEESAQQLINAAHAFSEGLSSGERQSIGHLQSSVRLLALMDRAPDALEVMGEAISTAQRCLGDDHEGKAQVIYTGYLLYCDLERLEDALVSLREAVELVRKTSLEDPESFSLILCDLASQYEKINKPFEAEAVYRELIEHDRESFGEDHEQTIADLVNLARLHREMGQYGKAEVHYARATKAAEQNGQRGIIATCMNNQAVLYLEIGEHSKAEKSLKSALQCQQEETSASQIESVTTMVNLSSAQRGLGKNDDARSSLDRALEILTENLGPLHADLINAQMLMGEILEEMGDCDRACEHRRQALRAAIANLGPMHEFTIRLGADLSNALYKIGLPGDCQDLISQEMNQLIRPNHMVDPAGLVALQTLREGNPWHEESLEMVARALTEKPDGKLSGRFLEKAADKALVQGERESAWVLCKLAFLKKRGKVKSHKLDKFAATASVVGVERATREVELLLSCAAELGLPCLPMQFVLVKLALLGADWKRCSQYSRRCLEREPGFRRQELNNDLAYSLAKQGEQLDEALSLAQAVHQAVHGRSLLVTKEQKACTADTLGLVLMNMGQPEQALPHLEMAQRLDPCITHAFHLAKACHLTGGTLRSKALLGQIKKMEVAQAFSIEERQMHRFVTESDANPETIWPPKDGDTKTTVRSEEQSV